MNKKKPKCIDLFSGAGGLTLGFYNAGGIPVAAVDNDLDSTLTYKRMFPMCEEVHYGSIEEWKPKFESRNIDVIIGGPPCQGFSLARGQRFLNDPRNHLYKYFVNTVSTYKPKWFVLENVPGITNIGDGIILKQIYEDFQKAGYWISHRVINMADYGVPQTRTRAIFVGSRVVQDFHWPLPTHQKRGRENEKNLPLYRSIYEALSDLPWPLGNYFAHRANSQMRGPRNRNVKTDPAFTLRVRGDEFAFCEEPATTAFPPGAVPNTEFKYHPVENLFQKKMRERAPAWIKQKKIPTVEFRRGKLKGTRRLTIREQARLQSFPDWFEFSGSQYSQGHQIGNAVPPLFAEILFAAILDQTPKEKSSRK